MVPMRPGELQWSRMRVASLIDGPPITIIEGASCVAAPA